MAVKAVALLSMVAAFAAGSSAVGQVQIPHRFSSGAPARAAEVNDNFDALASAVNANTTAIRDLRSGPASGSGSAEQPASVAIVAATGGRYTTPQQALDNLTEGDGWCRAEDADPAAFPCAISIAPGIYEIPATLVIPPSVSVIGYGPKSTVLRALPGVALTVQLGPAPLEFPSPLDLGISLRDLSVENSSSIAIELPAASGIELSNVRAVAQSSSDSTAVRVVGRGASTPNRVEWLEAIAVGGTTSVGLHTANPGPHSRVDGCSITVSGTGRNVGIENAGFMTMSNCDITAVGGQTAIAVRTAGENTVSNTAVWIYDSRLRASEATSVSMGFYGRFLREALLRDVEIEAAGLGENTGIWLSMIPPFDDGYLEAVRAEARGGTVSTGMYNEGGHHNGERLRVLRSSLGGFGGQGYGVRLGYGTEGVRLGVESSSVAGSTASMFYNGLPLDEWAGNGPPLIVSIADSELRGTLSMSGHFVRCVATFNASGFYADDCPPGSVYSKPPF